MRIFVIGATGYIGGVVAQTLRSGGHSVLGLARTEAAALKLQQQNITPHHGALEDVGSLIQGASESDGIIYAAAGQSFAEDHHAVRAILDACTGSGKFFIFTSGSGVVADSAGGERGERIYSEDMPFDPSPFMRERVQIEQEVIAASVDNIRGVVLRPPLVYGHDGSIQIPYLIEVARQVGHVPYIGAGENIWSTVHVDDLADLYLLAVNQAAPGELFHAGSGEVQLGALSGAVARLLDLGNPVRWSITQAQQWSAFMAGFGSNSRLSSAKAHRILGWMPYRVSVLEDIALGAYRRTYVVL